MRKAFFLVGIIASFSLPNVVFATMPLQPRFTDVAIDSSYNDAVYYLRNRGVVNGYEDGTFKPERAVSRAEFLKMVLKAAERNIPASISSRPFPDVVMTAWFAPYIREAVDVGIIDGYPDGKFYPDRTVSRIEAIKMLLLANYIAEKSLPNGDSFSDVPASSWFRPYAAFAATNQLVDAYPGNLLKPDEAMNRGQIAELIFKLYQKKPELAADTREIVALNAMDSARILITPENVNNYDQEHGPDSSACQEQFDTTNADQEILFSSKSKGISIKLPYNRLWGNQSFRVNPYDYVEGAIKFGTLQHFEGCGWVRALQLEFLSVRPEVERAATLGKEPDVHSLQRIKINGNKIMTYVEDSLCSRFNAVVLGSKYDYHLSMCGTWEDMLPVLETISLIDAPASIERIRL